MPNPYKEGKEDGAKGRPRRTYTSEVDQVAYNSAYNHKLKERQARIEAEKAEATAVEEEQLLSISEDDAKAMTAEWFKDDAP